MGLSLTPKAGPPAFRVKLSGPANTGRSHQHLYQFSGSAPTPNLLPPALNSSPKLQKRQSGHNGRDQRPPPHLRSGSKRGYSPASCPPLTRHAQYLEDPKAAQRGKTQNQTFQLTPEQPTPTRVPAPQHTEDVLHSPVGSEHPHSPPAWVPSTHRPVLNTSHVLAHINLNLTSTPQGRYCFPHFTDDKTKAQASQLTAVRPRL